MLRHVHAVSFKLGKNPGAVGVFSVIYTVGKPRPREVRSCLRASRESRNGTLHFRVFAFSPSHCFLRKEG